MFVHHIDLIISKIVFIVKNNIGLRCWLFNKYLFGTSQTLVTEPKNVNFIDKWLEGGDSWNIHRDDELVCVLIRVREVFEALVANCR